MSPGRNPDDILVMGLEYLIKGSQCLIFFTCFLQPLVRQKIALGISIIANLNIFIKNRPNPSHDWLDK